LEFAYVDCVLRGGRVVVIVAAPKYERLKEPGRRVLRLDEMPDCEIEAMMLAEIPSEYFYSLTDIPD
jgi:hypothetical protein